MVYGSWSRGQTDKSEYDDNGRRRKAEGVGLAAGKSAIGRAEALLHRASGEEVERAAGRSEESDVDQWIQKQLRQMETKPNEKRR